MRLIDADELIEQLTPPEDAPNNGAKLLLAVFVDAVKAFPTIDAVPVVRCRECKNWETDWEPRGFDPKNPRYFCGVMDRYPDGDWYCAQGIRKGDGDENA